jgi:hypothetical protein
MLTGRTCNGATPFGQSPRGQITPPQRHLVPTEVESGLDERVGAVGAVAQLHDLIIVQREDREELPLEALL